MPGICGTRADEYYAGWEAALKKGRSSRTALQSKLLNMPSVIKPWLRFMESESRPSMQTIVYQKGGTRGSAAVTETQQWFLKEKVYGWPRACRSPSPCSLSALPETLGERGGKGPGPLCFSSPFCNAGQERKGTSFLTSDSDQLSLFSSAPSDCLIFAFDIVQ